MGLYPYEMEVETREHVSAKLISETTAEDNPTNQSGPLFPRTVKHGGTVLVHLLDHLPMVRDARFFAALAKLGARSRKLFLSKYGTSRAMRV